MEAERQQDDDEDDFGDAHWMGLAANGVSGKYAYRNEPLRLLGLESEKCLE